MILSRRAVLVTILGLTAVWAGLARAQLPAPRQAIAAARGSLSPDGVWIAWDRFAVAWVHPVPAPPEIVAASRDKARSELKRGPADQIASFPLSSLLEGPLPEFGPSFFNGTELERELKAGHVELELLVDLPGLAHAGLVLAHKDGFAVKIDGQIGMVRLRRGLEHRIWLTDLVARMAWTGETALVAWQALLTTAREEIAAYQGVKQSLELLLKEPVTVDGPFLVHKELPPAGRWRYQEVVAAGLVEPAHLQLALTAKREPVDGVLLEVPVPGSWASVQSKGYGPPLLRPADGFQLAYVLLPPPVRPQGSSALPARGPAVLDLNVPRLDKNSPDWTKATYVVSRFAQVCGWDLAAIDERKERDRSRLELGGVSFQPRGFEGRALVLAGRHAAALALYPGLLAPVAQSFLRSPTRVRARAGSAHSIVFAIPEVTPEELAPMVEKARRLEAAVLQTAGEPLPLDRWIDLPRETYGVASFPQAPQAVVAEIDRPD